MIRMLVFSLVLLSLPPAVHAAPREAKPGKPLSVLFIGNSYTYVNDLPAMLASLAEAGGGRRIVTAQHTPGGCTLLKHVQDGKAAELIRSQHWDVVVLQEQSQVPFVNPPMMHENARKLDEAIRKQGARTVFYLTWARRQQPQMQAAIDKSYLSIAKELKAGVAPVGPAWQRAMKADAKLVLHAGDGSHPNPAGTYLAACVFYATLLDKSPVGLPGTIGKKGRPLVKLSAAEARRLQTAAWEAVQGLASGR